MSVLLKSKPMRRTVLRGVLGGVVALPFLDCFLNDNGTALASGSPLPVRFGTWFWGLGHSPGYGISDKGDTVELLHETVALEPYKRSMNYFSGFNAALDGHGNLVHYSGLICARTGTAPAAGSDIPAPTLDVLVSDVIGQGTRFRSIDLAASGGPRASYSARSTGSHNAAELSPLGLYTRVFGPGFIDPNTAEFRPDPAVMVRESVLSDVSEDSKRFIQRLGAADKTRMDQYFSGIRDLEQQLTLQLQKPAPNEACKIPERPGEVAVVADEKAPQPAADDQAAPTADIETVVSTHKMMAKLLAMALACNQSKVFTMTFSAAVSGLHKAGQADNHHTMSHEEPVDPKLGYQAEVSWFNSRSMGACADFVEAFGTMREGAGTLLDNSLIFAHSDTNDAKVHAIDGIPVMLFGAAGGRIKTGIHIAGNGDPITRVGLTAMQVMGVPISTWGTKSNQATKPVRDILV